MPLFKSTDGWNRSELDPYFKTPNGLEVQLGYDWNRSWTTNYIQYSSKHGLREFRGRGYYVLGTWMLTGETARAPTSSASSSCRNRAQRWGFRDRRALQRT